MQETEGSPSRAEALPGLAGEAPARRPGAALAPGRRYEDRSVGDDAAWQHLQRVHAPVLLSYVSRLARGDPSRVGNVVRETLLRARGDPEARDDEGRWSRAWLFTMARTIVAEQAGAADISSDNAARRVLEAREVRQALDSLPERARITLVEMYFRERSVSEAADVLDIPAGTVTSRVSAALRSLREVLASRGFDFASVGAGASGPDGEMRPIAAGRDKAGGTAGGGAENSGSS